MSITSSLILLYRLTRDSEQDECGQVDTSTDEEVID